MFLNVYVKLQTIHSLTSGHKTKDVRISLHKEYETFCETREDSVVLNTLFKLI